MAMDFYGALFGWNFADMGDESGNYLMCSLDGRTVTGIGGVPPGQQGMPATWTTYLATSDAEKTCGEITGAGGQLFMPPMDVLSAGRMAIAADPTGAVFGLWQAGKHYGAQLANVPGALCWNEGMTRDFERAQAFYTDVFGYTWDDMSGGGFVYAVFKVQGNVAGGLGTLPPEVPADVPPHWTTYFGVSDTDAIVATAQQLGGDVVRPASDSPYGRQAGLVDNQGAHFTVISVDRI